MSCSSDSKRGWDLFNDYIDFNQSTAENKRRCIEQPPLFEMRPDFEWLDTEIYNPGAADISLGNGLDYFGPSTPHLCDYSEETSLISPPGPCPTDLSSSTYTPNPYEIALGQNSGNAVANFQDSLMLLEFSGNELDCQAFPDEPSGIYPPSDLQGDSPQRTNVQGASGLRLSNLAADDIESSDLVTSLNASNGPKELPSSQIALASRFPEKTYDTCFGMVVLNVPCSTKLEQTASRIPMTIRICGSSLKLYYEVSNKYAALVDSPTLSKLIQDFAVTLAPTFIAPRKMEQKQQPRPREITVEIVIYGLRKDMDAVGDLLSDNCLYLQHPKECDPDTAYVNPQYWLRPGSQMPKVEGITLATVSGSTSCKELLDEVHTNQLLQLFDCANGPTKFSEVGQSLRLRTDLQDHQMKALAMMTEKEQGVVEGANFKTLWEATADLSGQMRYRHVITGKAESPLPTLYYGGLLADEMGLGKTLSILALIAWFLDTLENESPSVRASIPLATLIVAPKSTIPGWKRRIERHIHSGRVCVALYHGTNRNASSTHLHKRDIVLTSYETMRSEYTSRGQDSPLYSEEWARIVLDEDDYGALLSFIRVPPFTNKAGFDYWLANPISNNKSGGLRRLKKLVTATCLRRTKNTVKDQLKLPQRTDREETIELDGGERELYDFFKFRTSSLVAGMFSEEKLADRQQKGSILPLINFLRLICDHGEQLLPAPALKAWSNRGASIFDWNTMRNGGKNCALCKAGINQLQYPDALRYEFCLHIICSECAITDEEESPIDDESCPICDRGSSTPQNQQLASPLSKDSDSITVNYWPSTKVRALLKNLQHEQRFNNTDLKEAPIKSVIFSFWTKMLDMIETALRSNGFSFQRIDGQKSLEHRIGALDTFNNDPAYTVMLASIGCVAEGYGLIVVFTMNRDHVLTSIQSLRVDLSAANYVHLVEPHWNPMLEEQALDRVHRIGQTRDVVTIRYIVKDSIETYVQDVQQEKLKLIKQCLDDVSATQAAIDEKRWKRLLAALK
ncbi:hypothetical protein GP486_003119 [Trichoglossum hirsutum]|uniref:Uncharacterized protein n=1 Tax=Trichoglossum hirsutum TaxID=265104 RepID=A0A9P8LDT4_9PEZI|nr:hypothetical protein GP486_003119 [Trichoglossum hirsutum]